MKKTVVFLFVIMLLIICNSQDNKIIIPKESLRFRIIANSNTEKDQLLKLNIRSDLLSVISEISSQSVTIDSMRNNIQKNIPLIESIVSKHTDNFNVSFGQNYFPSKLYKDVLYKAGEYESLVITLGQGIGKNWWCVLFPPLCLLEAEVNNLDEVTYDSYLKKIINEYL